MSVFLRSISNFRGGMHPIEGFARSSFEESLCLQMRQEGFRTVQVSEASLLAMVSDVVDETLKKGQVPPASVDAIVLCSESLSSGDGSAVPGITGFRWELQSMLGRAGLVNAECYGVWLTACASFTTGLKLSSSLVRSGTHKEVLLVHAERLTLLASRFMQNGASILSDMATAALVSAEGDIEVHGITAVPIKIQPGKRNQNVLINGKALVSALQMTFSKLEESGSVVSDFDLILGDSFRASFYEMALTGCPVFSQGVVRPLLPTYGHPFGADGMLALKLLSEHLVRPLGRSLFLNVGPTLVGAIEFSVG